VVPAIIEPVGHKNNHHQERSPQPQNFRRRSPRLLEQQQPQEDVSDTESDDPLLLQGEEPSMLLVHTPQSKLSKSTQAISSPNDSPSLPMALDMSPKSYQQAMESNLAPLWRDAIKDELNKMAKYDVWTEIPRNGQKTISARWVFTTKINGTTGQPEKLKARWVARGYSQQWLFDYDKVFAAVAHKGSIRAFLATVNAHNLELDQVDITAAFLNGDLEEEIYVDPPEGSGISSATTVLRLKKALYSLKQSPRCFYKQFYTWITSAEGSIATDADPCISIKRYEGTPDHTMVCLHVSDQLIASTSRPLLNEFKQRLDATFECVDSGAANYFLGFNIIRDRRNHQMKLSQRHYLKAVVEKYQMVDSNPTQTPLLPGFKPVTATDEEFALAQDHPYAQVVRALLYASTITRPDLLHTAGGLCQFISKWSMEHWNAT
jgi:hypothetical protein